MKQITLTLAADFINNGYAGFYSYRCQAPIAHPTRMCVFADRRWWLIEDGEFQVEDRGIEIMPGPEGPGWLRVHQVKVDDKHPICQWLLNDQRNDRGPETTLPVSLIQQHLPGNPIGDPR